MNRHKEKSDCKVGNVFHNLGMHHIKVKPDFLPAVVRGLRNSSFVFENIVQSEPRSIDPSFSL